MGFSVVGAHLIVFIAVATAGTLLAATLSDVIASTADEQHEALVRHQRASNEAFTVTLSVYDAGQNRVRTEWRNDGGDEIDIDLVTILIEGIVTPHGDLQRFRVKTAVGSGVWMPEELLEVWENGQGNVDIGLIGPYGTAGFRRP